MAFSYYFNRPSNIVHFNTQIVRTLSTLRANKHTSGSNCLSKSNSMHEPSELFEYTSGRWLWNDDLRHSERRRSFNVLEFKRIAAAAVDQDLKNVARFEKLAEGGFNRTFLITMHDGFQFLGRIPYPITEPKHLVIASEVATMEFLRSHGMPVPKVYSYSATADNASGTEYIFMELIPGRKLGDVWFDLSEKARITVVTKLVELESRLFAVPFPARGSLYHTKDLQAGISNVVIPATASVRDHRFCIGPDTSLSLWHGKRLDIQTDRGPYMNPTAILAAGAKKEIAYLKKYGRPLHPFQRLRREIYNYAKQSPQEHLDNLYRFLQIAPYLAPDDSKTLTRPTLRHPDLQPNNIFISDDLQITGLIDWQHSAVLPLFLQCGIPNFLQNYGDPVSESLMSPSLPCDFDDLSEREQFEQVILLRQRQLHYFYIDATEKLNPTHYEALTCEYSVLRRKLFDHSSCPWEGDNVTLKTDLIQLTKDWSNIVNATLSSKANVGPSCPISFADDEIAECLRLNAAQVEADEQLQKCRDIVGIGPEGWLPLESYEEIKQREIKLKADALDATESDEERRILCEHWIFDDFDEDEYS